MNTLFLSPIYMSKPNMLTHTSIWTDGFPYFFLKASLLETSQLGGKSLLWWEAALISRVLFPPPLLSPSCNDDR